MLNFVFLVFMLKTLVFCQNCHSNININDIKCFDEVIYFARENKNYRAGHFAMNSKGDMIIEYSFHEFRLFYGLKKNGKNYFPNISKEIEIKSDIIESDLIRRFESVNLFISFLNDSLKEKEYLMSISSYKTILELHDLENGKYNITEAVKFFENSLGIYSFIFQILETKINNENIYFLIYISTNNEYKNFYIEIKKFEFLNFNFENIHDIKQIKIDLNGKTRIISSIIIDNYNLLVLFYMNCYNNYFSSIIYDYDLINVGQINIQQFSGSIPDNGLFFKSCYLYYKYITFIYFINQNNFEFKILCLSQNNNDFEQILHYTDSNTFSGIDITLNEFLKIDNNRLVFITTSETQKILNIILFDLYNNYTFLKIRYYRYNFNNEKILKFKNDLSAFLYNDFLAFTATLSQKRDNEEENVFPIFLMFGYANGTDFEINIFPYFSDTGYYNNSNNLYNYLIQTMKIENNIFGYEKEDKIKMVAIPDEIIFLNNIDNSRISNNDTLDINSILKQNDDILKKNQYYYLDYQFIVKEPDYDKFYNNYIEKTNEFNSGTNINTKDFFTPKIFYGRTNTLKFKLCHSYCKTCKKIGIYDYDQKCESCLENYSYYNIYSHDWNNQCVPEGYFFDKENGSLEKCNEDNSKFYIDKNNGKKICIKDNYECPYNYSNYNSTSKECSLSIQTYQITKEKEIEISNTKIKDIIYNSCYNSCETCDKNGNETTHNCKECKSDFPFMAIKNNYLNCYKECPPNITSLSKDNNFSCEIKLECPPEFPYENTVNQQCVKECNINDKFNNICKLNYINKTKSDINIDLSKQVISNIKNGNMSEIINEIISSNKTFTMKEGDDIHILSTLKENLKRVNYSSINLGDCEQLIRSQYNIKNNEEIILYEVEHYIERFNIPIIEYALFIEDGKKQINLSICDNMNVLIYIPVSINENDLDKYNPSSEYYNNDCNKQSNEEGLDMTLYDRKNQYNNNNYSLCEKDCIFISYNNETKKVECDCNIKNDMNYYNSNISLEEMLSKIENEKSSSNLKVIKCLNNVIMPEEIKSNSGFFLLLIILIIFVIIFIIYYFKGKRTLIKSIDKIIYNKFDKNENTKDFKIIKADNIQSQEQKGITKTKNKKRNKKFHKSKMGSKNDFLNNEENKNKNNFDIINKNQQKETILTKENNNDPQIIEDIPDKENDYELNILEYLKAIKYDKRTCGEYYLSLLKNKQLFLFTFCTYRDYNSGVIKKFILFLSFSLHYTINALFFDDANMHQILVDGGSYNIAYQFPKILISALVSIILIRIILETLVLTDRNLLEVKQQRTKSKAEKKKLTVIKCINIKFIIFFVINFFLLILFWFYLTCFNGIYENTQIYLFENTIISFAISLFYPFFWNIIPCLLRIHALSSKKPDKKCIYITSRYMQLI